MALIVWVTAAGIAMSSCFVYGELGAAFPDAGGDYEYLRIAYGDMVAFSWAFVTQVRYD